MQNIKIGIYILLALATVLCSCSTMVDAVSGGDIIPYPRTPGIIPLDAFSQLVYSHTAHDTSGNSTADLHCAIGAVYGLDFDTLLTPITEKNFEQNFQLYLYEYEWEDLDSGILVSYRERNVDTTGIYIHGEYFGAQITLYKKPILWLKYPAAIGDTWYRASPDSTDTLLPRYEVLDTSAVFSIPCQEEDAMSPVECVQCYLYKRTEADTVGYYYYTRQYGLVGYLEYIHSILRRTVLLKSYNPS